MDRLITINGRPYPAAEFDLNLLCDFEDRGITLEQLDGKMFNVIRLYVASCMNTDVKTAGREISKHLENGGSLEELAEQMNAAMEDSGFFRSISKNEDSASPKGTRKKKSESEEVIS